MHCEVLNKKDDVIIVLIIHHRQLSIISNNVTANDFPKILSYLIGWFASPVLLLPAILLLGAKNDNVLMRKLDDDVDENEFDEDATG